MSGTSEKRGKVMERFQKYGFLNEIEEIIGEAKQKLEEPQAIEGSRVESMWFIDGSSVTEERQGSFVAILSAASLGVISGRYVGGLPGREHLLPHIIMPKLYGEARAMNLMGVLELLEGIRATELGVEALIFDGNYLALLLTGYGSIYELVSQARRALLNENISLSKLLEETDTKEKIDEAIDVLIGEVKSEKSLQAFYKSASRILTRIYDLADELYNALASNLLVKSLLGKKFLIDYSVLYVETNVYLRTLGIVLLQAKEKEVSPFWVAKESTSRFLSEILEVKGWLSDSVLLDTAWRDREKVYLILEGREDLKALRPVNPPSEPVASPETIRLAYNWNKFDVVYFKASRHGQVLQATYPHNLISIDRVEDILSTLVSLSEKRSGYPKPLALVHHKTLIPATVAETLAYKFWQSSTGALKDILHPLGREISL